MVCVRSNRKVGTNQQTGLPPYGGPHGAHNPVTDGTGAHGGPGQPGLKFEPQTLTDGAALLFHSV